MINKLRGYFHTRYLFNTTQSYFSIQNMNEIANKEFAKAREMINNQSFERASKILANLLDQLGSFKGNKEYNMIMKTQARCLFFMNKHKDAEMNYLNIIQYIKADPKKFQTDDLISARLDLWNQYLYSNIEKAFDLSKTIYKENYPALTPNKKAVIEYFQGVLTFLRDKEGDRIKAIEHLAKTINYTESRVLTSKALHNIGVIKWVTCQDQGKESMRKIYDEIDELLASEDEESIRNQIEQEFQEISRQMARHLFEHKDIIGVMRYFILSYQKNCSFDKFSLNDLIDELNEKLKPNGILTILCISEILLANREYRELGKDLLTALSHLLTEKECEDYKSKILILFAAYYLDTKQYEKSEEWLKAIFGINIPPGDEYNKLMACKFYAILLSKMPRRIEDIQYYEKQAKELEMQISPWSSKLSLLHVPDSNSWNIKTKPPIIRPQNLYNIDSVIRL